MLIVKSIIEQFWTKKIEITFIFASSIQIAFTYLANKDPTRPDKGPKGALKNDVAQVGGGGQHFY